MRLAILAVCAFIAAAGSGRSAGAADLPNLKESPVAPPLPEPAFSWSGLYVGVNGGFGLDHTSYPFAVTIPAGYVPGRSGLTEIGPAVGGQIGYNYQFPADGSFLSHIVLGVEADADWSNVNGSSTTETALGPATFGTRIQNFGTLTGRVGYSFGRLMIYSGAGIPFATTESYYSVPGYSGSLTVFRMPLGTSVTCGAGAEYAVTNNWSIKADYSYVYVRAGWTNFWPGPDTSIGFMSRATFHTARIGLNYHFDLFALPAPFAAKY